MRKFAAPAAIILALAIGWPSQAGESAYTDFPFENKACKPVGPEKSQEEIEMGLVSIVCPGYRDYQVYLDEADLRTSVHYGFLSERVINDYWESFAPFNSVGEKIEWRLNDSGVPYAAIQRFFISHTDPETGESSDRLRGQVLVISKVGQPDDRSGCVAGLVDALANPDANALARKVADEVAPSFVCEKDTAVYHGTRGERATDFQAYFGNGETK